MFIPLSTLRCLHRAVDLYGDKEGVICSGRRFTYTEFGRRCGQLAAALRKAGVAPGDRIAFLSFNTHKLLEGYYGVAQARAIVMPLNVRLAPAELITILNHSGARFLFFESDFAPLAAHLRTACPGIERYVGLSGSDAPADLGYEEFLGSVEPSPLDIMAYDENATAELFYTSGSTGTPKGVMLSHRTLYLHALSVSALFVHGDNSVDLHTIPLFHANGWGRPQACTLMGTVQVMVRRFEPKTVFQLIQSEGATTMTLVPTMANALLQSPDIAAYNLSSLQEIHLGGAASSPELIDRMEKAFGCSALAGYGLTETAPVVTSARQKGTVRYRDSEDRAHRQAMAGWAVPGVEVRVVDSEMNDIPRDMDSIGEVVVRGDHVMQGYFREPEATTQVMAGGWFHTGDMAVWDAESYIHIVDRKKDIIISGGENISSIEVENTICAHPAVAESAVVAAPDPKWGEIPVAFLYLKDGHALTGEELSLFLESRLAKFKMPRAFYFVSKPLPKTGTGKVLKRELREQFWTGRAERVQG
ncbi:MAG: acyl--CoA ligase family protein [Acidobacteriaceae bacterium]